MSYKHFGSFSPITSPCPQLRRECAVTTPCPCGFRTDPRRSCQCTTAQIDKYIGKISGPLLDRIDIHIEVPAVPFKELASRHAGTSSSDMRQYVVVARERQHARLAGTQAHTNAQMSPRQIREHCQLDKHCLSLLKTSVNEMGLSARATTRSSASPAPSPTWKAPNPCGTNISRKPSTTACWTASSTAKSTHPGRPRPRNRSQRS